MKLRIKGDSLRLRITPSEMQNLVKGDRLQDAVHFGPGANATLRYALELSASREEISARYDSQGITVTIPTADMTAWAAGTEVGLYGRMGFEGGALDIAIEKDFACLDKGEAENVDTFPHPSQGTLC